MPRTSNAKRKSIRVFALLLLPVAGGLHRPAAAAVVLFDNFGPNTTFNSDPLPGWWHYSYSNFAASSGAQYAFAFTPSQTAKLDKLYLPLDRFNGSGDEIMLALLADDNGKPGFGYYQQTSGSLLKGSYDVGNPKVIEFDPSNKPLLEAGKQYWVAARLDNFFNTSIRWFATPHDTTSPYAYTRTSLNFEWSVQNDARERGAFRVTGTVPEPASLGLLAIGVVGVGLRRRHSV